MVAAGAFKPVSDFGVTRIEQSLQVLAHVASTNRMWLLDNTSLTTFLETEMTEGLQRDREAKVLADVNATSGIQTQSDATSVLATLRKSITKCQTAGHTPSSFLLHPNDWEGVELALSSTNSVEHQGLPPYNPATQALFGGPVVVSLAEAAGVGTYWRRAQSLWTRTSAGSTLVGRKAPRRICSSAISCIFASKQGTARVCISRPRSSRSISPPR